MLTIRLSPWLPLAVGLTVALACLFSIPAAAQDSGVPSPGTLTGIVKKLSGRKPTGEKSAAASSATRFIPSGKGIFYPQMVASLSDDAEERKGLTELFENTLKSFDTAVQKAGMANDVAPALAFYVQTLWAIHSGKEVSDAGGDKMIGQLRAVLDGPEMAEMSNADKQSLYEHWICMSALNLMLYQAAENKDKETVASVRASAGAGLKALFGVEADKIAITPKGLEISGTVAGAGGTPPPANTPKVTYAIPPDSRVEDRGGMTILWRPKYGGVTKNDVEQYYYAILPTVVAAGKPDREAAFEETWKKLTDDLKVTWQNRTLIHRYYLPSGAVCYVAMGGQRQNETFGGYGDCDGAKMTLCLLDFGSYYVPVAQVYSWTKGTDNLGYIQGAFDAMVATVRIAGATKPRPYVTRDQLVGGWTHTSGFYSSTDYVYSSSGAYAGNVTNSSAARLILKLNADGTAKYDFFWLYNGVTRTDIWAGTWTFDRGKIIMKDGATGKIKEWTVMYKGKHATTGERFLALHYAYSTGRPLSPINSHSTDTELFTPYKK